MRTCCRSGRWSGAHDRGCRDLRPRQHHARCWPAHSPCRRTQALLNWQALMRVLPLMHHIFCQSNRPDMNPANTSQCIKQIHFRHLQRCAQPGSPPLQHKIMCFKRQVFLVRIPSGHQGNRHSP